ncbi:MAG: hypothetical protein ABT15_13125 [Pseudonocardia sp. SCN 73-27]|nr:MAG: hypothetical protein ABT15_13125 [Pseudonocardia sp. SCN 73-27]
MRVAPTATTHTVAVATSATRVAVLRPAHSSTTRAPIITTDIVACPDGSDSLVSFTSRVATGGRGRSKSALSSRNNALPPIAAAATNTASARRPRSQLTTHMVTASSAIAAVLPIVVTTTAAVVRAGSRTATASVSSAASASAVPLPVAPKCRSSPAAAASRVTTTTPSTSGSRAGEDRMRPVWPGRRSAAPRPTGR